MVDHTWVVAYQVADSPWEADPSSAVVGGTCQAIASFRADHTWAVVASWVVSSPWEVNPSFVAEDTYQVTTSFKVGRTWVEDGPS